MTVSGMTRALRLLGLAAAACLVIPRPIASQAPQPGAAPKLVVIVVVDQMRGDYLQRYGPLFTAGLKRLTTQGAWFVNAAYPYLNTVTCVGHSTIGTGTFPYHHGMVLNGWLDRGTRLLPGCTGDTSVKEVSYNGLKQRDGESAKSLMRPAIGEQIRRNARGRAIAVSLKPRSSIPLVGHSGDAVVWFDERGGWSSSTGFTRRPVPFVQAFVDANPITADQAKVWTKALPDSAYTGEDDVQAERPPAGMTRVFPHVLNRPDEQSESETFFSRWERSPFADEYLERLAEAGIDALALGKGTGTDFLAVSFSSLDLVGHLFGPRSHEVQDMLVRLDRTIGRLLDHLDRQVGTGNYIVALSADHGVADLPEADGGGRVGAKAVKDALERVFVPVLGAGDHVVASAGTDIYLTSRTEQRLRVDQALRGAAVDALLALPGVARVFVGRDLNGEDARTSSDRVRRAAALSYYPGRSGDLIISPKENWILSTSATSHGSPFPYDQRVPVVLFGACVRPGRYEQAASPADVAPSLASIAKISIAPTDGRVLSEAIVHTP